MNAQERELLHREGEVLVAQDRGDKRTLLDLERTIIVAAKAIIETLYQTRH